MKTIPIKCVDGYTVKRFNVDESSMYMIFKCTASNNEISVILDRESITIDSKLYRLMNTFSEQTYLNERAMLTRLYADYAEAYTTGSTYTNRWFINLYERTKYILNEINSIIDRFFSIIPDELEVNNIRGLKVLEENSMSIDLKLDTNYGCLCYCVKVIKIKDADDNDHISIKICDHYDRYIEVHNNNIIKGLEYVYNMVSYVNEYWYKYHMNNSYFENEKESCITKITNLLRKIVLMGSEEDNKNEENNT